jgi:hypothetical protein
LNGLVSVIGKAPYRTKSPSSKLRNGTRDTALFKVPGTIEGIEAMNMMRKGRVRGVAKGDVVAEARLVTMLFAIAA